MSLNDNLVAFWKLGEASGNRADSIGSNTLVDNNTVTQADGKVGKAAQFTRANAEYFSVADNTDLSTGDVDFTVSVWIYIDALPGGGAAFLEIINKYHSVTNQREWLIDWSEAANLLSFAVSPDGSTSGTANQVFATSFGVPPVATWIFIVAWHDSVNNTINIQVNDGPIESEVYTLGVFDGTADFNIGSLNQNASGYFDGRIDSAGVWKGRVLTFLERSQLYNGGAGIETPFLESTYTEPVTVVTQSCDSDTQFNKEIILPRFVSDGDDLNTVIKFLDQQAEIIEDKYNSQVARSVPCDICVVNGSIIFDCGKCIRHEVAADADINSISFINCFAGDELDILFRASKDVEISGWPSHLTCTHCGTAEDPTKLLSGQIFRRPLFFNSGGRASMLGGISECIGACIKKAVQGGASVSASVDSCSASCGEGEEEASSGRGVGAEPTEPTGACACTPDEGNLLTVVVCTDIDCTATEPKIELTACGGTPPYTWSVVGGETPTQTDSGSSDRNTKIEPTANTTPGEPGNAYGRGHGETRSSRDPAQNCIRVWQSGATYNCAGVQTGSCTNRTPSEIGEMPINCELPSVNPDPGGCQDPSGIQASFCGVTCQHAGGCEPCEQVTIDIRTQTQKDNGCKPCAATMEGVVITVTDAVGAAVSTIVST